MELDEMKTAWKELDKRLDRQETLSETFIRESIAARSQRSANKFLVSEMIGTAGLLLILPFTLWAVGWDTMPSATKTFLMVIIPIIILIIVWQLVKAFTLWGIDMSGDMRRNARTVRRYELYTLYEKRVVFFFLVPFLFLGMVVVYAVLQLPLWTWAFMIGMTVIGVIFCIWYYKKFFAANMAAIKRGLEELKDM